MPAVRFLTVGDMARNGYLQRLRELPAFRHCTHRQLERVARLIDDVELPAGTQVRGNAGELIVTLTPARALVIDRRALPAVLDDAPGLGTHTAEVPLHPA
jgi:hypothetical protein